MYTVVLVFLVLSLLLYVLMAGADFGAGILELFSAKKYRSTHSKITYKAIGPIWEANHIWLIVLVVILFNGFPEAFATLSTYLHIPLLGVLLGIVLRGSAFVFQHYDVVEDESTHYYAYVFRWSSLITPFFLGVTAGSIMLGRISPGEGDFWQQFMSPWLNGFSLSLGLFFCSICSFLAAVYLIGETSNQKYRNVFYQRAVYVNVLTVFAGVLVMVMGKLYGYSLVDRFYDTPLSVAGVILATASVPFIWWSMGRGMVWLPRLLAGFQISMVVLSWVFIQYPVLIALSDGRALTFEATVAPDATIHYLGMMLLVAGLLVVPALGYLLWIFKRP